MFHFSTDRLAGLDTMILRISPPKVSTLIPNHSPHHDTYVPVGKLKKQKPHLESRPPLVDKIALNNLVPRPPYPTGSMFLHTLSTAGEFKFLSPNEILPPRVPCPSDIPSFRPLPALPSAPTLQLPSFLNFSTQLSASLADPTPCRSTASPHPSAVFRVSSSPIASSRRIVTRKGKEIEVFEGPQWIPAFHHPNSPYVPWSSPVRRRILPPSSPARFSSSPCTRSGAVAPEPWASSTFSQPSSRSGQVRFSSSWKSVKKSVKKGVKTVVFHIGKSSRSLRMLCISQDMLRTYDDADTATAAPNTASNARLSTLAKAHSRGPYDSLASLVSSDSKTLITWLTERRSSGSCLPDNTPRDMSVEEYELRGSWLDLRRCNGGWVCGIQDCDIHTVGGSPHAVSEYPDGLRMAVASDSMELLSVAHSSSGASKRQLPPRPFSALPRFHSLPRLPCQYIDIHSAQAVRHPPRRTQSDA